MKLRRLTLSLVMASLLVPVGCREAPPSSPPRPPRIVAVTTDPPLPDRDGWRVLPQGAGAVTIRVQAENATRVRVFLVPTGTEMREGAQLLGEDGDGGDGWTVVWRYADIPITAHLLVQAEGPGGTAEDESLQVLPRARTLALRPRPPRTVPLSSAARRGAPGAGTDAVDWTRDERREVVSRRRGSWATNRKSAWAPSRNRGTKPSASRITSGLARHRRMTRSPVPGGPTKRRKAS